ncbi:MAG: COX15/CtaA family protein, partial [Pseudomonadota bacterium]
MPQNKSIVIWLSLCILLLYAIILVGGYTRLTHSGLSITEWKPVTGIIPPLDNFQWQKEFELYKASPEYKKINYGITLEEFKGIFLTEYWHRILGRLLGLSFLLPLLYFSIRKKLKFYDQKYLSSVLILIGVQGFIGWFMVKSGLIDNPNVSQYRLALHLFMAC